MATNKSFQRFGKVILAAVTTLTAVLPVRAGDWMPMLPDQNFYDFQLFAPPDLQDYEIYPEQSEGIFFNYDRLYWGITPPRVTGVAETERGGYLIPTDPISPQSIVQLNNAGIIGSGTAGGSVIGGIFIYGADPLKLDLNTSWMRTAMTWGNRYEGGWIHDNRGVQLGYFNSGVVSQSFQTNSEFAASSPTQIFTQSAVGGAGDGGGGGVGNINQALIATTITASSGPPDHIIAQKLTQTNNTEIQSASVAALVRRELGRRGSGKSARFSLGPRFFQFAESYKIGYESNQYAFNQGPTGGAGVGGAGAGGAGAGGAGAGGAGAGGAGAGGGFLGNAGGNVTTSLAQTSAGDVLGISGVDSLTGLGPSTPLQVGEWETNTYNNMVGPEFALLLESHAGRWTFSSELKFTAAMNWQNNLYRGANFPDSIGADYLRANFEPSVTSTNNGGNAAPIALQPPPLFLQIYGVGQQNATNAAEHEFVFSPIGEWRFGAQFRVSQAILLRAGYTGMWLSGIARASSNTAYRGVPKATQYAEPRDPAQPASLTNPWVVKTTGTGDPASPYYRQNPVYNRIGPNPAGGNEYVFTNGVDFGIEVKY